MQRTFLLLTSLLVSLWGLSQEAYITRIEIANEFAQGTFMKNQLIPIEFDYDVERAEGVRIFAAAFTNGKPSDLAASSGSPIYMGSGTSSSRHVTILTASQTTIIDEIRFQITNLGQTEVFKEFFVPCALHIRDYNIEVGITTERDRSFAPFEVAAVDVFYDAPTAGADVSVTPLYQGEPSDFATDSYSIGGGGSFGAHFATFFTEEIATLQVDQILVEVSDSDGAQLASMYYDVNWLWGPVSIRLLSLGTPDWPLNGEEVDISFTYNVLANDSSLIFFTPYSNGVPSADASPSLSPYYCDGGSDTRQFTINSGNQRVDALLVEVTNDDGLTLNEQLFPVNKIFGDFLVDQIEYSPPSPARLPAGGRVDMRYTVSNDEELPLRTVHVPTFEGNLIQGGYGTAGFPIIGADTFDEDYSNFFTTLEDARQVDQVRYFAREDGNPQDYAAYHYEVDYLFQDETCSACGNDAPPLSAPVGLSKSFNPVPFPNGVRDRVQLKWYKELPAVRYSANDDVACDLQYWPIRDLENNVPITDGDTITLSDVSKPGKELFKWPVKYRADGANNTKRVDPNTRYRWRVRCACAYGEGEESPWSDERLFNTPDFDPVSGIYTPPGGDASIESAAKDNVGDRLLVYPNPTTGPVHLSDAEGRQVLSVQLFDRAGRLLLQENGPWPKADRITLGVEEFDSGLYLLEVRTSDGSIQRVLIKE